MVSVLLAAEGHFHHQLLLNQFQLQVIPTSLTIPAHNANYSLQQVKYYIHAYLRKQTRTQHTLKKWQYNAKQPLHTSQHKWSYNSLL